jgi:hypothetical protein
VIINKPSDKVIQGLTNALGGILKPITIADASTKSGLSLYDAKNGLTYLLAEYRGSLSATSEGELLYYFPAGFTKPWEKKEKLAKFWQNIKKTGLGILKFAVRAWITVVMLAYVVIFALIILALTFKNSDRDEGHSLSGSLMFHTMIRLILDSLFWTFHPFSPFYSGHDAYFDHPRLRKKKKPFYEKVNRFFFGPEEKPMDEIDLTKLALQEIRAKKGRIGILDLMRVTGLSKEEADPFMAKLLVNHEGDILISNEGGIIYEFPAMRKSALMETVASPPPIWQKREIVPPFTGNEAGSNMLIICLNGFNLLMSFVAITNSWTIEKLKYIFFAASSNIPAELLSPPPEGIPLLLGWIPLFFSSVLFLIPAARALFRSKKRQEVNAKNGRRGLIRAILSKVGLGGIKEDTLQQSWTEIAQEKPDEKEFIKEIIKLGGELESDEHDGLVYRFRSIEAELSALGRARARASKAETSVGEVIFSSAK